MEVILESERVYLRKMALEDVESIIKLNQDSEVIRYLKPPNADKDFYIKNVEIQNNYYSRNPGMGAWSAIEKTTGNYIGYFGLKYLKDTKDVEISYALLKEYRGKGYCFEVSKELTGYAFNKLMLNKLIGIAEAENGASLKVLEKLGMEFVEKKPHYGTPSLFHCLNA